MSLQSDRWIRHMAQNQGMIEPFVDGQVRHVEWRESDQLWSIQLWI